MNKDNDEYTEYSRYEHIDDLDFVIEALREYFNHQVNIKGLDLGCGTGNMTNPLAFLGYEMVGIDISLENIRRANAKRFSKDNPVFL